MPSDGLAAVEAACAEATHLADVINILARHREPAPPVTILTPDALRDACRQLQGLATPNSNRVGRDHYLPTK